MLPRDQVEVSGYRLEPLREEHARAILGWRYPPPYDFYDPPEDGHYERYVREFLRPELGFYAILCEEEGLVGFCSYGEDGQVPGGDYSDKALDIGLGMRPELTGCGRGKAFLDAILKFASRNLAADTYRLTVADFNERAIKLYGQFGFREHSGFFDARANVPYTILIRDN